MARRIFFKEQESLGVAPNGYSIMGFNSSSRAIKTDESGVVKLIESVYTDEDNTIVIGASGGTGSVSVNGYYQLPNYTPLPGKVLGMSGSSLAWIDVGGGGLQGSGTTNYLAKWNGAGLTGSLFFDSGSQVSIGPATIGSYFSSIKSPTSDFVHQIVDKNNVPQFQVFTNDVAFAGYELRLNKLNNIWGTEISIYSAGAGYGRSVVIGSDWSQPNTNYLALVGEDNGTKRRAINIQNTTTSGTLFLELMKDGGNVTIGVTNSSARLHIKSSSGNAFRVDGSSMSNIFTVHNSKSVQIGRAYNGGFGNTNLFDIVSPDASSVFQKFTYGYNNGTTIDSFCYIGVDPSGIASNSYKQALNVSALSIYGSLSNAGLLNVNIYDNTKFLTFVWENPSGSNYNFTLRDHNSSRLFTFGANGNFGIGYGGNSNTVDEKLVVNGNIRTHESTSTPSTQTIDSFTLKLKSSYWNGSSSVGRSFYMKLSQVNTTPTERFGFFNNGDTELMSILSTGNVGIYTTTPTSTLHVKSSSNVTTDYALKVDNFSGTPLLHVRNDGNVGIGTAPSSRLHIKTPDNSNSNNSIVIIDQDNTYSHLIITNRGDFNSNSYVLGEPSGNFTARHRVFDFADQASTNRTIFYGSENRGGGEIFVHTGIGVKDGESDYSSMNLLNLRNITSHGNGTYLTLKPYTAAGTRTRYGHRVNIDTTYNSSNETFTTIGIYSDVRNSDKNYALIVPSGGGSVGIGTITPSSSSIMELSSTTQGFLPPRMTTTQRDNISSPAQGLVIFNTTTTKLECYDGTTWQQAW